MILEFFDLMIKITKLKSYRHKNCIFNGKSFCIDGETIFFVEEYMALKNDIITLKVDKNGKLIHIEFSYNNNQYKINDYFYNLNLNEEEVFQNSLIKQNFDQFHIIANKIEEMKLNNIDIIIYDDINENIIKQMCEFLESYE